MKRTGHFFEVFADIAPDEDMNGEREPFEKWYARVRHRLPQHLPKAVAEDWLYDHWDHESEFSDLDLTYLQFRLELWPSARLSEIRVGSLWGEDVGQPL